VTFISYAQNFEDVMLWRALKNVTGGFYIDVGASHPDNDSVTKAFYQRGWHGINVEPVPASAHLLRVARPRDLTLQVAVGDAPGLASLFVVTVENNTGLSTLSEAAAAGFPDEFDVAEVQTEIRTLASICEEAVHGPIHFLKIDAEQAERAVLQGADFARFRPWIVLVEATAPMSVTETHAEWDGILLAADYHFVWFDGLNRFYVSAEKRGELAHAFKSRECRPRRGSRGPCQ
jgi:FkbM family methyltransferase